MKRLFFLIVLTALLACAIPAALTALAAQANEWGHGDDCWWCGREAFSLDDDATVWKYLMAEITVLDVDAKEKVYVLDAPGGNRVKTGQYEGFFYGTSAAMHVLAVEDGWALVESYDMSNQFLRGYVKASLLKTVKPHSEYGMVVDKQTQRLYLYGNGVKITELLVSTGLPEKGKAYNETAAGEFLICSRTGEFQSGNMYCDLALRFNGGDLLHLVPYLANADGTRNYAPFERYLGSRASHGCIRVQLKANNDGYNMQWLWDNLKLNTKIIVWDDTDRAMLYPDDDLPIYYNPDSGKYYHADQNCTGVKNQYLPLTAIRYAQLRDEPYSKLTPCSTCLPPNKKPQEIDAHNLALGISLPTAASASSPAQTGDVTAAIVVVPVNDESAEPVATAEPIEEADKPTAVLVIPTGNTMPGQGGLCLACG